MLQITERVRECLQQRDANCSITPAPPESCSDDSAAALLQARAAHPQQHRCPVHRASGRAEGLPCRSSSPGPGRAGEACGSPAKQATISAVGGMRICERSPSLRAAVLPQRCACKDATPASPLRKIVTAKSRRRLYTGAAAAPANEVTSESERDEFARPEDVQVRSAPCTQESSVSAVWKRERKRGKRWV